VIILSDVVYLQATPIQRDNQAMDAPEAGLIVTTSALDYGLALGSLVET
jgi:hypothetical protein